MGNARRPAGRATAAAASERRRPRAAAASEHARSHAHQGALRRTFSSIGAGLPSPTLARNRPHAEPAPTRAARLSGSTSMPHPARASPLLNSLCFASDATQGRERARAESLVGEPGAGGAQQQLKGVAPVRPVGGCKTNKESVSGARARGAAERPRCTPQQRALPPRCAPAAPPPKHPEKRQPLRRLTLAPAHTRTHVPALGGAARARAPGIRPPTPLPGGGRATRPTNTRTPAALPLPPPPNQCFP